MSISITRAELQEVKDEISAALAHKDGRSAAQIALRVWDREFLRDSRRGPLRPQINGLLFDCGWTDDGAARRIREFRDELLENRIPSKGEIILPAWLILSDASRAAISNDILELQADDIQKMESAEPYAEEALLQCLARGEHWGQLIALLRSFVTLPREAASAVLPNPVDISQLSASDLMRHARSHRSQMRLAFFLTAVNKGADAQPDEQGDAAIGRQMTRIAALALRKL